VNRLRTASLRRRVTLSSVAVLAVVMLLLAVVTDVLFAAQSDRELRALLQDRIRLAEQLTRQGVGPPELVDRVETATVKLRLTTPAGAVFGHAEQPPPPPGPSHTEAETTWSACAGCRRACS
jgi:two-component system, OmpR family, sensor kinase